MDMPTVSHTQNWQDSELKEERIAIVIKVGKYDEDRYMRGEMTGGKSS